jgi:SAM-dependent methyltransferase
MSIVSAAAYHAGKYLPEEDLLPESLVCPWCRFSGARNRVLPLQRDPDVWLLECPRCHARSASRAATESALDAYYASYFPDGTEQCVTCGSPGRHAKHILRYVKTTASPIAMLDYGGGDGSISHAVATEISRPANIVVVDYNEQLVSSENPLVTLAHARTLDDVSGTFDLVLASAILEHLPEPAEITRRLLYMLNPGGFFYARTPCVVSLLKLFSRMNLSYDFTFPAHFHDLGQDFWSNILSTIGVDSEEWRIVASRPSVVETSFSDKPVRTAVSYAIKAPWWILRGTYAFTGGWEVFIERRRAR